VSRVFEELLLCLLLVKYREDHDWESGEGHVVELVKDGLVQGLSTEGRREAEPELWHDEQDVLVKHIDCQNRIPTVSLTPMVEQK